MKAKLKLWLKVHFMITLSIWTIITLCISFVRWDLYNPIQWIIDMPTYTNIIRGHILLLLFVYEFVIVIITAGVYDFKEEQ